MSGALFLAPLLALPFVGIGLLPRSVLGGKPLASRLAAGAGIGAVVVTAEMLAFSLLQIRWSVLLLLGLPLLVSAARVLADAKGDPSPKNDREPGGRTGLLAAGAVLLLTAYAAATARATSSDLLLFWGTKGEKFGMARGVDVALLRAPENFPMHIDYPPLLPFLSALGTMLAGRFAWGASLLLLPIFLLLATAVVWGFARDCLGASRAGALTALFAALFGYGLTDSLCAGNAEAPLLFFEALSLSLLLFNGDSPANELAAGFSLAGAALTKFEGALFVACAVAGIVFFRRRGPARIGTFLRLSVFSSLLLAAWVLFCRAHGIFDSYAGGVRSGKFALEKLAPALTELVRSARYDSFFLPWIAVGLALIASKMSLARIAPAAIGALYLAGMLFIYLHGGDDLTLWISWSAPRLLLTPLLCFFFAAAAPAVAKASPGSSASSSPRR